MVKFENRVALNKITRFVETTPLVIFFHCHHKNYFQKKLSRLLLLNHYTVDEKKSKPKLEDFSIKLVKNKYVKKALHKRFNTNNELSPLQQTKIDTFTCLNEVYDNTVPKSSWPPAKANSIVQKIKKTHEKQSIQNLNNKWHLRPKILCEKRTHPLEVISQRQSKSFVKNELFEKDNSLFKGNRFIFTLKKISFLSYIKDFVEDENIHILGGIYENCVIDHNQVKRLVNTSENNSLYLHLNNSLKQNLLLLINLLNPQYKIIALLKQKALKTASSN